MDFVASGAADELLSRKVEQNIIDLLPHMNKGASLAQVVAELTLLKEDESVRMAARITQGLVAAVLEVVTQMTRGMSPDRKVLDSNDFWKRVSLRLVMFCEFVGPEVVDDSAPPIVTGSADRGASAPPIVVRGSAAVSRHMAALRTKAAEAPTALRLDDLDPLQTFKFAMTAAELTEMGSWVTLAVANAKKTPETDVSTHGLATASSSSKGCSVAATTQAPQKVNVLQWF